MQEFRLRELLAYFLWLGATGFGGPVALAAAMQRDLVDKRKWFTQDTFRKGLTLSKMAPGPMATQLAMYLGWVRAGAGGAALTGIALVLPSFIIVVLLAMAYIKYGNLSWIEHVFTGISPAVLAIIMMGAWRLSRNNLGRNWVLWVIALVNAVATAYFHTASLGMFVLSALVYLASRRLPPRGTAVSAFWFAGINGETSWVTLREVAIYFAKSGILIFGSGLVIVPFLKGGVVDQYHWLTERQFVDAVAVAMVTPGPVVITTAFIGFLVAGFTGALLAAVGVFLPCYLLTIIFAPYLEKIVAYAWVRDAIDGITAAAVGAIAGGAIIIGIGSITSWQGYALAAVCLGVLLGIKKVPEPLLLMLSGILGYFLLA